ncbi:MAG: sensor histidine kinase [Solirubrobacteraceae bacterium]
MSPPLGTQPVTRPFRPRLPRQTARLRLALLYGGVLIACGTVLLAITYLLVSQNGGWSVRLPGAPSRVRFPAGNYRSLGSIQAFSHAADLHTLLLVSGLALAVMAIASILVGWLIAGRVLRPLRTITSTAREISATSLHARLALHGPDDELKELADTIDALLARLEASFQAQRLFVANASHELCTPLARLKTLLQVSLADPSATLDSMRSAQQRSLAAEGQLEKLIDALLALASGEQAIERREPLDLAAITKGILDSRAVEIAHRQLQLETDLDHAWIDGNHELTERLIANLLDNAIRHNTSPGWLRVTTHAGELATLTATNNGPPIPTAGLERLKQPFQRLAADRADSDGHGLGLSIATAIVTARGGTLNLDARPEGGLRARVELPRPGALADLAPTFPDTSSEPALMRSVPAAAPRDRQP